MIRFNTEHIKFSRENIGNLEKRTTKYLNGIGG